MAEKGGWMAKIFNDWPYSFYQYQANGRSLAVNPDKSNNTFASLVKV